ncbi:unnamed protein product [Prunus armeniaca]|uniref:Uncharacterized protein n=1 Tax=Prunus armeniaca TaxID=36596 RepID=A0A6J5VBS9_PRUAR|nr:unnamed protein product [Prunus armeniaca]
MTKPANFGQNGDNEGTEVAKTTVQSARFEIKKFVGTNNFTMWQCKVKDVLIQQGLPVVLGDMHVSMKKEEWKRLNAHACSSIRLCLGKAQKYGVMNISSTKDLWNTLESKYLKKSVENRLYLKKTIKDEDKALILMDSLPESYESFVMMWIYGRETNKFDEISSVVMNHEVRNLDRKERNNSEALMVKGRSKERKYSNRKNSKSPAGNMDYMNEWVLDIGCTHHMTSQSHWFSTFKTMTGIVYMSDDNPCSTQGISSVMIKHHDGVIQELHGVRYVPNLKKNLISLGTLELQGYKFYYENNILKVARGALVMIKAPRRGLLYFWEGKSMEKQVAMAADDDQIDSSSLWHMRLGHVGNKALQGLIKQGVLKGAKSGKVEFCEHYVLGKQTNVKFGTAIHQTEGILDYVHSDV